MRWLKSQRTIKLAFEGVACLAEAPGAFVDPHGAARFVRPPQRGHDRIRREIAAAEPAAEDAPADDARRASAGLRRERRACRSGR